MSNKADTKGDTSSHKRAETEGDTPSNKAYTEDDVLSDNRTDMGGDVPHKEAGSTKGDSISSYRMIIELYKKRMKQNKSGNKL